MDSFEIFLILVAMIIGLNHMYMAIYTRFERAIAESKYKNYQEIKPIDDNEKEVSKIKEIYHWFERFSYGLMRYNLICIGKIPSYYVRNLFYRKVYCMDITKNTVIHGGCEFRSPWNIHGDRCIISVGCIIDGRSGVMIGQDVVLGSNVHIWTMEHSVDDSYFRVLSDNALPVVIEAHVWICSDATVLPGCIIREGAVVATRACVVRDCDEFSIYGGIPAKKIRERNKNLRYQTAHKPSWLFY